MSQTFPRDLDIQVTWEEALPNLNVGHTSLHQLLLNLAVNARDAMGDSGRLVVRADSEQPPMGAGDPAVGSYVHIRVTDTGVGIPAGHRDRIFESFYTTKPAGKGTGLGLATVAAITNRFGGIIELDSVVGRGTRFDIYFPSIEVAQSEVVVDALEAPRSARGQLILVAEDAPSNRDLICETLRGNGYTVLEAANGAEAVALYAQHQSDLQLVICDLRMPVMDGRATCRAINEMNSQQPILMISGLPVTLADLPALPRLHFLSKPFTVGSLLREVASLIEEASGRLRAQAQRVPPTFPSPRSY